MKKTSKRVLSLITGLFMLLTISVVAFAEQNVEVTFSADTTGESGQQIVTTETSVSIPLKIAVVGEGTTDDFDASVPNNRVQIRDCNNESYPVTLELIKNEGNTCYIKVSAANLNPGTSYYLLVLKSKTGDQYKQYYWSKYADFAFVTEGTGSLKTQWGDNNGACQVLYYTDGKLEVAPFSVEGAMQDWAASTMSPWASGTNGYYMTTFGLEIASGVTHIGNYTFSPLVNLKEATISDTVTSIGNYAFKDCVKLRDVYLNANAADITIADNAFDGCSDVVIHVKPDQLEAYQSRFANLANVTFEAPEVEPQEPTFALISSEGEALLAKKHTTLTVDVENGNVEDYTYKFIVYNKDTQQWYKLRGFDADNTFDWYTGPAGEKTLYADIQDAEGNLTRTQLDVTVNEPTLKVDKFTSSAGTELAVKSHTTLLAKASEGTAPYEYKFIVYNSKSGQWYKIQDFGEANTCDWYTGPEGTKTLYVDVKDADGTVVRAPLEVNVSVK